MRLFAKDLLKSNMPKVETSEWCEPYDAFDFSVGRFKYRNNIFYASSIAGKFAKSNNLEDWTVTSLSDTFIDFALANNFMVAICQNSSSKYGFKTATDGTNWTSFTAFKTTGKWANCVFREIVYADGYFIACGHKSNTINGFIARYVPTSYSTETGWTWTWQDPIEINSADGGNHIYYLNNNLIVLGVGKDIYISSNRGDSFVTKTVPIIMDSQATTCNLNFMMHGGNKYIIFGQSSYSTGGLAHRTYFYCVSENLESFNDGKIDNIGRIATYGYNKFFSPNASSFDTEKWNTSTSAPNRTWKFICYGNGKVVVVDVFGYISYKTWKEKE